MLLNKITNWILFSCVLLLGTGTLLGQPLDLKFNHLRLEDGLAQTINAFVHQDSFGYIWISTTDGLNRFDGINMEVFRPDPQRPAGMKGKLLQSEFYETDVSDIWFCTTEAINVYRRQSGQFEHFSLDTFFAPDAALEYYVFHLDDAGNLWTRIEDVLFHFNIFSLETKRIGNIEGVRIRVFDDDTGSTVFAFDKDRKAGARKYQYGSSGTWTGPEGILDFAKHVYHLHDQIRLRDGRYAFAATEGLLLYDPKTGSVKSLASFEGDLVKDVLAIEKKNERELIISSSRGILLFDLDKEQYTQRILPQAANPFSLGKDKIWELQLDRSHNLWATMWFSGLDYTQLNKVKFRHFKPTVNRKIDGRSEEITYDPGEILEDRNGNIWCVSRVYGLLVYDQHGNPLPEIHDHKQLHKLLGSGGIYNVYEDQEGFIWLLPYQNYLIRFNPGTGGFLRVDITLSEDTHPGKLAELPDGRLLLTGKSEGGILEVVRQQGKISVSDLRLPELKLLKYFNIYWSTNGQLHLFGTNGGVEIWGYEEREFSLDTVLLWEGQTFSVREFADGNIYVGGDFGLIRYHTRQQVLEDLSAKAPASMGYIYSIESVQENILWLSTNNGLVRFNTENSECREFSIMDGLQSREFNANSSMLSRNGELWFGGIKGYNIFRPEDITRKLPEARVNLINVTVNDRSVRDDQSMELLSHLELDYWEKNIEFNFVSSEYSDPAANLLRYRLETADGKGYDEDWITVANHNGHVRYPQLPSGEYRFIIEGSNSDGDWSPRKRTVSFQIATPFWETWLFQLFIFLILMGLLAFILIRYYRHRLRVKNLTIREQRLYIEKEEALQQERDRLAKDMHDELGGGLTTIRLLLRKIRLKNPKLKAGEELKRIDHHSSEIIKNMRFIVWALQRENEQLDNFAAYLRHSIGGLLEDHDLEHGWRVSEALPDLLLTGTIRKNLWLCVKEATHNIIKHARADFVTYRIDWSDKTGLLISVSDNGVGIPDLSEKLFGYGLKNMSDRIESIGGSIDVRSVNGTTISFQLPTATLLAT